MSDDTRLDRIPLSPDENIRPNDEGGLRAPPHLKGWRKWWWWFDFIVLVKLARLRFIAILVVIGLVITQWDLLTAYYEKWTRRAAATDAASGDTEFFCPMHPTVVRDNSKEKCPICFMPLSKRKKGSKHEEVLPAGVVNRVQLSPYRVALAGARTAPVDFLALTKQITAVGFVEFNERGQRTVSARFAGRLDKLQVGETGRMVKAGDELASIYSPDLNVTAQALLDAKRSRNQPMLESSRERLRLLGIGDDQIDELLTSGKANTHLKIRSPINGHVIKKYVREGQYVQEGTPLYDVADLSTVWIQAQVFEDDLVFLPSSLTSAGVAKEGDKTADKADGIEVTAMTRAFPNEPFRGQLAFIFPHIDQDTRTVTVRFELENPDHKLRPGSTATVTLSIRPQRMEYFKSAALQKDAARGEQLAQGRLLALPEAAVIDTGSQTIVYREASPGVFEGVLVKLGPKMTGPDDVTYFPVLDGLAAGERIVSAGSFLVDAETRLNPAAGSIYFGGSSGSQTAASTTTVRPSTPEDADAQLLAVLAKLPPDDRRQAESQRFCAVLGHSRLGSMGQPIKVLIDAQPVFLCCAGCRQKALADPQATLAKVKHLRTTNEK